MGKRDSVIIYRSFYEAIRDLPKENQAEVWKAIFEFSMNFKEEKLTGLSKTVFTLIKPQLSANNKKFEIGNTFGHLGGEHGKKGGRPKKIKPSNNPQETHTEPANVNDNVNVNDNEYKYFGYDLNTKMPDFLASKSEDYKLAWVIKNCEKALTDFNCAQESERLTSKEEKLTGWQKLFYDQQTLDFKYHLRPRK